MIKDKKFLEELKKRVERLVGSGYCVDICDVNRNNGQVVTGLSIRQEHKELAKVQYLEQYYEEHKKGIEVEEIASGLAAGYIAGPDLEISLKDLLDYDAVKSKLVVRLINLERNRDLLKKIPYVQVHDLAAVFYILYEVDQEGQCSSVVKDEYLKVWGIDLATLMKTALENSQRSLPVSFRPINNIMLGMAGLPDGMTMEELEGIPSSFYVLSNRHGLYGAAVALYPGVLQKIADYMGHDLMLLPSSTHEFLVVNKNCEIGLEEALEMVSEINRTEVSLEDFLADSVYIFEKDTGKVKVFSKVEVVAA